MMLQLLDVMKKRPTNSVGAHINMIDVSEAQICLLPINVEPGIGSIQMNE